ncbi:MAG TPA: hypothetical protein VEA59_04085 [Patescibacteria group bacterium]|nr:hypothetical protein [Patescibacteria group bacterium]
MTETLGFIPEEEQGESKKKSLADKVQDVVTIAALPVILASGASPEKALQTGALGDALDAATAYGRKKELDREEYLKKQSSKPLAEIPAETIRARVLSVEFTPVSRSGNKKAHIALQTDTRGGIQILTFNTGIPNNRAATLEITQQDASGEFEVLAWKLLPDGSKDARPLNKIRLAPDRDKPGYFNIV